MTAPTMAMYKGELVKLRSLAIYKGCSRTTFYQKYIADGSPSEITDEMIEACKREEGKRRITVDGVHMKFEEVREKFKTSSGTICKKIKEHGRQLTSAMFARKERKTTTTRTYAPISCRREREALSAIPDAGTWERQQPLPRYIGSKFNGPNYGAAKGSMPAVSSWVE